jgi:hypothetical protein
MRDLYHIVYLSVANESMSESELDNYLVKFRDNNKKLDVTGMLLYKDGNFIQVIEGKREVIEALFEKISNDNRHSTIVAIREGPIDQRSFPNWSMGFQRIDSKKSSRIKGFSQFLDEDVSMLDIGGNRSDVLDILNSFKKHII